MLDKILSSLDLDTSEQKVYLFLLGKGPSIASTIAKRSGIRRTSLYGILKRLSEHQLVSEISIDGVKLFSAQRPEQVELLLRKKIEQLNHNSKLFQEILPALKSKHKKIVSKPKIEMFEGKIGLQSVLKDMILHYDLSTFALWPVRTMLESLSSEFHRYLNKERIKNNLYTRAIWPNSQIIDFKKHPYLGVGEEFKREIRIAPKSIEFDMGYWSYANKVAFVSSQKECFGFLVESEDLVNTLKMQFDILWQISTPINVNRADTQNFLDEVKRY